VEDVWSTIHNWVQAHCRLKTMGSKMSTAPTVDTRKMDGGDVLTY